MPTHFDLGGAMNPLVSDFRQDVRYGIKLLLKNPSFTITAVLTLALGIGATSAIFSVLNTVVLRPLPFPDPEQLVFVLETNARDNRQRTPSAEIFRAWREQSQTIQGVDGVGGILEVSASGPGGAQRIGVLDVGLNTLSVLGVRPVLGRWFRPDETLVEGDTAESLVISHDLWQSHFGGDPNVIGKSVPGWDAAWGRVIVGVMPAGFWIHPSMSNADGWYSFDYTRIEGARPATIARLKPGVSFERAQAELDTIARRVEASQSGNVPDQVWTVKLQPLHEIFTSGYSQTLYLLLGAVGFVLLIASVNVANLQLSRGAARHSEMATRAALGAGRWRLLRQLISENILLALAGGVLGLGVAYLGIWIFVTLAPDFYPPSEGITVSGPVLVFTLGVAILTGVLSGLMPAFRASRTDLADTLKQAGRGGAGGVRQGVRRTLVVVEVALALVLLVGAGLMINSYARVMGVDMGFNPDNLLTMDISLAGLERYRTRYDAMHFSVTPQAAAFYAEVMERLRAVPGITGVGITTAAPPRTWMAPPFRIIGGTGAVGDKDVNAQYHEVSEGYFRTMGISLVRGRLFTPQDGEASAGVAVINETLARQYFGGEDPIGRLVEVYVNRGNPALADDRPREIVGVVRDTRMRLRDEAVPVLYIPYQQHLWDYASSGPFMIHARKDFVIRTGAANPMVMAKAVRKAVEDVDASVSVDQLMSMRDRLADSASNERFWMRLLGVFAGLAVFLATVGIYGVVSYSVEQRTREFGIRTAMGARKADILALVLREGILVTLVGLIVGIGGAFGLTRLIASQLYGVSPMDPLTIGSVAVVLLAVAMLACFIPGRYAAKVDPLQALRIE
jgi:putative ABC transport system permease protein